MTPTAPKTINEIFYGIVDSNRDRVMTYKQTVKWIPIASRELYRDAVGVARTLASWGIQRGDRVAILSENRPEWALADFGAMLLGAVVVPIYTTLTAEQTAYLLKDSGARVIFLSTAEQLKKFLEIRHDTQVEKAVIMDYVGITEAIPMHRLMHEGPLTRDPEFDAAAKSIGPDEVATIIYTSGTTGIPKGVILTHGNMASNIACSLEAFGVGHSDVYISFLPLSHVTARHVDYAMLYNNVTVAYCPKIDQLLTTITEVLPSVLVAVPRVYEKIAAQVKQQTQSGLKHRVYEWALKVGRAHRDEILAGKTPSSVSWKLANTLVFSKVRKALGGHVQLFISGGAPLGRDLAAWYADIGIRIHEGYGLTETSPVISVNTPANHKLGTVGKPLRNVEVKIADDGEILVRGPSVFHEYWKMPEDTRNAFAGDWFKTGDIGNLDSDGFLSITDRKKDLLKTSGGKFIAPQPLENKLKADALVQEAVLVGDKRKFISAIIQPNFAVVEDWARRNDVKFSSREELVQNPKVRALFEVVVGALNDELARFETIKKFILVAEDFSIANGTMTPSMKVRRRMVEERYRPEIDALYAEESVPAVEAAG
ncbi:MAG TPA: long-chain fatty acid--CoA ligase [Terriglobales bacterium]|nr:long-chain fatty acid--CoA ligase [Terriglobales bacterium]